MAHKTIRIKDLELSFPHKTCFVNFNYHINYGCRIAIIGNNGSGKSTLLKMIAGTFKSSEEAINIPDDVVCGYVPQVIEEYKDLSGGQRLNKVLTQSLSFDPNILLLDEATNHLDERNRKSLLRMLQSYSGTLILVSHDTELLRYYIDTLWHIDNGKIHVFSGNYDDYLQEIKLKRASTLHELERLGRQKKDMHDKLMQEQQRAGKSKAKGEKSINQRKWPTIVSKSKALRSEETTGRKKFNIDQRKQQLAEALNNLRLPEIIVPKFSIEGHDTGNRLLVQISDGTVGYASCQPLLSNISLMIFGKDRIAIIGDNGSGKSTLIKAILGEKVIHKDGNWFVPRRDDIGYLDQHYNTLNLNNSVLETISTLMPHWSHIEVRRHLNDFLFRKHEEVNAQVSILSGGERARLSLAQIAARTPKLLILDEITNNLDLETKGHVEQVLKAYPGAMMIISHDKDFLQKIGVQEKYDMTKYKS